MHRKSLKFADIDHLKSSILFVISLAGILLAVAVQHMEPSDIPAGILSDLLSVVSKQ